MKNYIFLLAISTVLFASCEKVINVDLNNANPQYAIEASLYEGMNPFKVHVAKTTDYYGKQPQEQINDAVVVLTDDAGNNIVVPPSGNGWYTLTSYTAVAGKTYYLKVTSGGKEFTASSRVEGIVPIDSVTYEFKDGQGGFLDPGYEVTCHLADPAGQANNYRLLLTVDDTLRNEPNDLYLFDDKFNNGKHVAADFFERFDPGDTLDLELLTMDRPVYNFYTTLNSVLNNQNGPAPANPLSNFKGGALGYFGAFSSSKQRVILPQ